MHGTRIKITQSSLTVTLLWPSVKMWLKTGKYECSKGYYLCPHATYLLFHSDTAVLYSGLKLPQNPWEPCGSQGPQHARNTKICGVLFSDYMSFF
jgi:hypothetical protein